MARSDAGPTRDPERLAELRRLDLLDTGVEEAFDRLTRLASSLLGAPVGLVSLVDEDRQFFRSQVGLPEPVASGRETPLSHSFCQHTLVGPEPLIVPTPGSTRCCATMGRFATSASSPTPASR